MVASNISFPTVKRTSLGGIQPNIVSAFQSGVEIFLLKLIGVGLSTTIPLFCNIEAKLSNNSFARSIVSLGLGPNFPLISESSGTLASNAGSGAGIQVPSALPTIICFNGSHSFQLLTIVFIYYYYYLFLWLLYV